MQTVILVVLLAAAGSAVILLIAVIAAAVQRKKVEEQWKADQKEYAQTGTISEKRNHATGNVEKIAAAAMIGVAVLIVALVFRGVLADLHDQIVISERNIKREQAELRDEVEELLLLTKKNASLLAALDVTPEDGYDPAARTASFLVTVTPKSVAPDTSVTLCFGGREYAAEREGNAFSARIGKNVFTRDDEGLTVVLSSGQTAQTEIVDETLFPSVSDLTGTCFHLYLPSFLSYSIASTNTHSYKKGVFTLKLNEIDVDMMLPRYGDVKLTKCTLVLTAGGRIMEEKDVLPLLTDVYERKAIRSTPFDFEASFEADKNETVSLVLLYEDSTGASTEHPIVHFPLSDTSEIALPHTVVTFPDGTTWDNYQ